MRVTQYVRSEQMDGRFAAQPRPDRGGPRKTSERLGVMNESDLSALWERVENGDVDTVDELIELGEHGNLDELRRLAEQGNSTAAEQLTELQE